MGKSSVVEGKNTGGISHTPEILLQLPLHCGILGWNWSVGPSCLTSALEHKSERVTPKLTALNPSCGDQSFGNIDALCSAFPLAFLPAPGHSLNTPICIVFLIPAFCHTQLLLFRANFLILLAWRTPLFNPKVESSLLR